MTYLLHTNPLSSKNNICKDWAADVVYITKQFVDLPFDAIAGTLCYVYNMGHKYTKGKLCNTTVLYT